MARAPNENVYKARKMFENGMKLIDIANKLELPAGTIRRWKSTYKWDSERSDIKNERSRGGQVKNKNAVGHGAPNKNKNAEKHGFFSKWLPKETLSIIQEINNKNPLDILWENIQIQYAAIIRAQSIMYVNDKEDITRSITSEGLESTAYDVQYAWDKHAVFLTAQSRAMKTLEGMLKQYEDILFSNRELVTEEHNLRIKKLKVDIQKVEGNDEELQKLDKILEELDNAAKS